MEKFNLKAFNKFHNNSGFTLIEILVAITIMSMMMLSIYNIVDNNIGIKDRTVTEDREYLQVYTAISRIEQDLSLLYSPLFYDLREDTQGQQEIPRNSYGDPIQLNTMPSNDFFRSRTKRNHPIPKLKLFLKMNLCF